MNNISILRLFLITAILLTAPSLSISQYQTMKEGEEAYDQGNYEEAVKEYYDAVNKTRNPYADYNLGNALSKSGKKEEALRRYQNVIDSSYDESLRSKAYYNMGNNYVDMEKYEQGVNAYKNALRLNPKDEDARKNLMYAQKQLKKRKQQKKNQQEENNKDKNREQKDQQQSQSENSDQQNKNNKEKQSQEQQQNEQNKKDQQKQSQQNQSNDSEQQKGEMKNSKEKMNKIEAERILQMIQDRDKKVQKKVIQKKGGVSPSQKDW